MPLSLAAARLAGLLGLVVWLTTGCGQEPSFQDDVSTMTPHGSGIDERPTTQADAKDAAAGEATHSPPPVPAPATATPEGDDDASDSSGKRDDDGDFADAVTTDPSHTATVDTFYLADIVPVRQTLDNSVEPVKRQTTTQTLPSPRVVTKDVLARSAFTKRFDRKPPLRTLTPHTITAVGKRVDVFVTVDDSESFPAAAIERTRVAVKRLIDKLYDTDWVLFLGGLEGVNGNYDRRRIAKGTLTLAQAYAAADDALDAIFAQGSLGDERVFRSLNRLAADYASQDRDDATHVYLVITDAPNCKDRFNDESSSCSRSAGNNDHHGYLFTHNTNVPSYMRHMSLFGAYYRMTDNPAVCGNADALENPTAGETLVLNSQYAQLAADWQSLVDGAPVATPAWIGDLCAATPNLTWLDGFAAAVREVAARRFRTPAQPDVFPADPAYDLRLVTAANGDIPDADFAVIGNRVLIAKPPLSGTVQARYHAHNDYRRTDYTTFFDTTPAAGSVRMSWNGEDVACAQATSFTGLAADVICRHDGRDFFLRAATSLPVLAVGAAAVQVTVAYENVVETIRDVQLSAGSAIFTGTVAVTAFPAAAADLMQTRALVDIAADGRSLKVRFDSVLPPGQYRFEFRELAQTAATVRLDTPAATGAGANVRCALAAGGAYPCSFVAASNSVTYSGLVPVDAGSGKADLVITYNGFVEPISVVGLRYPPFEDKVAAAVGPADDRVAPTALAASALNVALNQVNLVTPLMPGERLTLDYEFRPPLPRCHVLSATAVAGFEYKVWYGPPRNVALLAAADYTLEENGGEMSVCIAARLVQHGRRLVVGYVSAVAVDD